MIVKIQRAIMPPDGPMLVYNKDRSFYAHMPVESSPGVLELLGDDLKAYFHAKLVGSQLQVGERVMDRNW